MRLQFSLTFLLTLVLAGLSHAQADWVEDYDSLLQKYVTAEGVRYEAWHDDEADVARLGAVVEAIATESLDGKADDLSLAFYLNAYNAWILHHILRDYPTDGPGGGGFIGRTRFFKRKDITVAGEETSFHLLENETIRPTFGEPRIHFALNCASTSCPPLHPAAFRAETLDETLTALTVAFINTNPHGVAVDEKGKVTISKIFDWYEDDFEEDGGVLAYLNQYRTTPLPSDTRLSHHPYLWLLNASE